MAGSGAVAGGRWRLLRNGFIAADLAAQVALPLHDYAPGANELDERFAWRMFSPIRVLACEGGLQERRQGAWSDVALERDTPRRFATGRRST